MDELRIRWDDNTCKLTHQHERRRTRGTMFPLSRYHKGTGGPAAPENAEWAPPPSCWAINTNTKGAQNGNNVPIRRLDPRAYIKGTGERKKTREQRSLATALTRERTNQRKGRGKRANEAAGVWERVRPSCWAGPIAAPPH